MTRRAILVVGMHRSGTSAVTRCVGLLGAALPRAPLPAAADNPRGFWEAEALVGIDDAILAAGGSRWDDWRRFETGRVGAAVLGALEEQLAAAVEAEFGEAALFVVKDPRICRLLPVWLAVLRRMEVEVLPLIVFRQAGAVARSLEARNGFSQAFGALLWLRHVLDAERDTRGMRRAFVSYEALVGDWRGAMERVGERLGVAWPNDPAGLGDGEVEKRPVAVAGAAAGLEAGSAYAEVWCRHAWAALRGFEEGDGGAERLLDQVRGQFEDASLLFGGVPARPKAAVPALREVTLLAADSLAVALSARAVARSMAACGFAEAALLTDAAPQDAWVPVRAIGRLGSRDDYSAFVIKGLGAHVRTSHVLLVQWDGFVVAPEAWDPAFLGFDYVGARWWWQKPGSDVGNGGFSLRSRRLLDALADPRFEPQAGVAEDELICRVWRPVLEREFLIRFAPSSVADRFSQERAGRAVASFGFHGVFNFPRFLDDAAMVEVAGELPDVLFGRDDVVETVAQLVIGRRGALWPWLAAWRRTGVERKAVGARLAPLLHPRELERVMEGAW